MKNIFSLLFLFCTIALWAQNADRYNENNSDRPRDPRADQMNFVPNEVLVKFKDNVQLKSGTMLKSAGISAVDQVLGTYNVEGLEKLFPSEIKLKSVKIVKDPQGQDMKIPSLHNIYKISIPQLKSSANSPISIFQFIEELKALAEVEYAEPNYIFSIDDLEPSGPVLTVEDMVELQDKNLNYAKEGLVPNDPLYSQQWYIPAIKADMVWEQTTGDTTQVIAILDTGVDWNHPDLKNKIWNNADEIPDNNRDDDGNGLIDDIRGWDYINNDNNPTDDNSHGTHVAGIAAAEANNGIGIAGVNWKAKIMPIKVFQSSGRGDAANISKGIIYAFQKGATVINMSFGSYARSLTMENALANAYATTLLVAAAGNDGLNIEGCYMPPNIFFPAGFSFVLGVQAPEASFSNYDCNGPTYSTTSDLVNYEMKAPGTNILSTIPNGNYRVYQGTSMAAPLVSGALSLYRKLIPFEEETPEFMWVKLIQATEQYLDIYKALTIVPAPEIWFLNNVMVDTIGTADRDGRVDAGETIQLWFRARNTGGQVDSVYWKIRLAEFEDSTTCNIVKSTSYLGSIGPYATRTSETDPMVFDISSKVAHDRDITFDLLSWYKGASDTLVRKFVFTVENGEELSGVMDTVLILTANKLWLIKESFRVGYNGHLIINPGTKIKIHKGKSINVRGWVSAIGTPDSLIVIEGISGIYDTYSGLGFIKDSDQILESTYKYVQFKQLSIAVSLSDNGSGGLANVFNCTIIGGDYLTQFRGINNFQNNLIIRGNWRGKTNGSVKFNNFINCIMTDIGWPIGSETKFNNFNLEKTTELDNYSYLGALGERETSYMHHQTHQFNSIISDGERMIIHTNSRFIGDIQYMQNQYWGTTNNTQIRKMISDFWSNASAPLLEFNPKLNIPSDSCHAIVWKVLVNGKDAQDEIVEPVGVGRQRFDIYFNRAMNKNISPNLSFGVRFPYTQNVVNEDGSWSDDGKIYTVYKTIKLTTSDGIQQIRVAEAKEINGWDWEIPIENFRFKFILNASTSASIDFMATPGLGKVALEWNNNDLEDGLGFNMYRMEHVNDSVLTNPVLVNSSLITDTLYTDFAVTPNKKYYYYYKILRTNLMETDSSRVVSATPFTASKGDANGDLSVNVLDITTIVAYLLNHNPQPFIMEAADLNSDGSINVLDIVGVVNLILNDGKKSAELVLNEPIQLYIESDTLFVDAPVAIGGIQFDISGVSSMDEIQRLIALDGFESGYAETSNGLRVLFYSMSGKTIPAGNRIPLLKLKDGSAILKAIFADKNGASIPVHLQTTGVWNLSDILSQTVAELGQNFPNPLTQQTTIPIRINEPIDAAIIRIFNMYGQEVEALRVSNPTIGEHLLQWNSEIKKGLFTYRLEIIRGKDSFISPARKMIVQ